MVFIRSEYMKEYMHARMVHNRALITRWKRRKGCAECGYNTNGIALDLDHIDPTTKTKRMHGWKAIEVSWSKNRIKQELAKCQVLCANCHRIRTYHEQHWKSSGNQSARSMLGETQ